MQIWEKEEREMDDLHTKTNRICFSASATVEGAIVIPLFVYVCFTLLFLLWIEGIRSNVNEALYDSIRMFARYGYVVCMADEVMPHEEMSENDVISVSQTIDGYNASALGAVLSDGLSITTFHMVFVDRLGTNFAKENYVVGENAGWIFAGSKIFKGDDCIDIKLKYVIKNPFDIFGTGYITICEQKTTAAWLGESKDAFKTGDDSKDIPVTEVYVAIYGTVYHVDRNCTYLTRLIESCSESDIGNYRNMAGGKYYNCRMCSGGDSNTVYFTQYGIRYHKDYSCSELQRTITTVKKENVSGLKPCEKCSKGR